MNILERGSKHSVTLFEIRLENDVIVLRGTPTEAAGAVLRGKVTFCLQDSLAIKGIHLKLVGVERIGWYEDVNKSRSARNEKVILEKSWQFLDFEHDPKTSFVLGAGNYEYPFEHVFPGDALESVEGLQSGYIVYRMKATLERPRFSHDISTRKHLRVVRTLAPEDEALSATMAVENLWPEKCEYSISIPAKACVFGTSIPLNVTIFPLLKGLKIGKVTCTLREFDTITLNEPNTKRQDTRNIQTSIFNHGDYDDTDEGSGRWLLDAHISLPKSLSKCVQDCEVGRIKVRHKLRVSVQLHNPAGHTSELRASLPVQLFISPNHLMGDDNEIHSTVPTNYIQDLTAIPPRYDEHVYDRLWDDLPHDYNTPLHSGANTPAVPSRNTSSENLATLGAQLQLSSLSPPTVDYLMRSRRSRSSERPSTSSSSGTASLDHTSAEDLQRSLAGSGEISENRASQARFDSRGRRIGIRSAGNTRPGSPEQQMSGHVLHPIIPINISELSRVPSYETAIHSTSPIMAGDISSLPSYVCEGWTGVISPTDSSSSPRSIPRSIPRSREPSPPRPRVQRLASALRSGHVHPNSPDFPGRTETGLRILQARGR